MAGIERVGSGRVVGMRTSGGVRPATGFSVPIDAARPEAVMRPATVNGLAGLQDNSDAEETPARQRTGAMLAELAALQRALLCGGDPVPVLRGLEAMLGPTPGLASPALLAVLSAVRLRARVELARRGWGQTDNPFIANA